MFGVLFCFCFLTYETKKWLIIKDYKEKNTDFLFVTDTVDLTRA